MNEQICQDIQEKLEATNQVYLPELDMPLSITKSLFTMLDTKRKGVAEARKVPQIQYDFEDVLYELIVKDPPEEGGNPMTNEEIDQVANKVAAKVLDEITPTVLDPAGRGMLLHFTEHAIEGAGLVVNEARARATPCNCFTYKGREYCFSPGVIGMMSSEVNPEQITEYCAVGKSYEVKPGIKQRFESFAEAAEEAHKEIEEIPKGERLVPWLSAMGKELERRGIEV